MSEFAERVENIINDTLIEHDQVIINAFKDFSEKLKISSKHLNSAYSAGEVAGVREHIQR